MDKNVHEGEARRKSAVEPTYRYVDHISEKRSMSIMPLSGDFDAERAIAQANKRVAFFKQIKTVSLRMTNAGDWRNEAGKPYLTGPGAEKLKPIWGLYIKDITIEQIGTVFECRGIAGSKVTGEESQFIGGRDSADTFFTGRDGQKTVDIMDVRKAAYTNFSINAITRLLGLRGLTWEELESVGIVKDKVGATEYQAGAKGGQQKGNKEVETQRGKIRDMIMEMANDDIEAAKNLLVEATKWKDSSGEEKPGKDNVKFLTLRQIPVVYGKVKTSFDAWVKSNQGDKNV